MWRRCSRLVLVLTLALSAPGCGEGDDGGRGDGGGSGDGAGDGGGIGGGDEGDGGGDGSSGLPSDVNGELRGVLYFDAPDNYIELDLSSSVQRVVRNRTGDLTQEMSPSADAQEFITTDDAVSGPAGAVELLLTDRDGATAVRFEFAAPVGRPELSADSARIAVDLDGVPVVADRDGQVLAEFAEL
jgi:hypothetical protein